MLGILIPMKAKSFTAMSRAMNVRSLVILALLVLASGAAYASPPSPEQILADAARYTVKVKTFREIGLNQDDGGSAAGTGFLIDRQRGWILTNAHVASRSPALIEVSFNGGDRIKARRIHVDAFIDLAVLEIPTGKIPEAATEAKLACDVMPVPGTSVFAYGHPWGLSFTASRGVVSGQSWIFPSEKIQTDAAINSGNSGGPLISLSDGRVVGVSSSTYKGNDDQNATAIGLAEPIPPICHVVKLIREGKDTRLKMLPLATATSGDDLRPRVAAVFDKDLALKTGDLITEVNGHGSVRSLPDLLDRIRGLEGSAAITVVRQGREVSTKVPLVTIPDPLKVKAIALSGLIISEPWRLDHGDLNPKLDLVVDWVEASKEAGLSKAMPGDIVSSVNGRNFNSIDALYAFLQSIPEGENVELIMHGFSDASEFYREYRLVMLRAVDI